MDFPEPDWTPKVHPLARDAEADDPWELMAQPAVGDPDVMLDSMLQEFLWMGWNAEQLESLFHNPGYPVLVQLREYFGAEEVRRRIDELIGRCGVIRFRETVVEPEDEDPEPELIQITLPLRGASPCERE